MTLFLTQSGEEEFLFLDGQIRVQCDIPLPALLVHLAGLSMY